VFNTDRSVGKLARTELEGKLSGKGLFGGGIHGRRFSGLKKSPHPRVLKKRWKGESFKGGGVHELDTEWEKKICTPEGQSGNWNWLKFVGGKLNEWGGN